MAVYQGARRPSGFALPWVRPEAPGRVARDGREVGQRPDVRGRDRRATRTGARAGAHSTSAVLGLRRIGTQRRVSLALAGIVVSFSVAFVSLSQSVQVAATSYDTVRLQSEHDRLVALQQELQSDVERLRGEPAIRKEALDAGLGQLGAPVVIPAR
jgi:hypothetical protein